MKILKNNYIEMTEEEFDNLPKPIPYPRKFVCEKCKSELEYDREDLRMGEYGCMYLDCPLCKHDNMLDDHEDNIKLTVDNIKFPVHFHHFSKESGAKERAVEEVRKEIRRAVEYFRNNKNEEVYNWHTFSGDLFIMVHRYSGDEEYSVIVSRDFYNMEIGFEEEDYE